MIFVSQCCCCGLTSGACSSPSSCTPPYAGMKPVRRPAGTKAEPVSKHSTLSAAGNEEDVF
jgi:hypothetical protein